VFVVLGIGLRLQRYLLGRSFRQDEATLALAIQARSLLGLIRQPLPGGLTAPIGFLALEKLFVVFLGNRDYIWRLLPILSGCLSVVLMFLLARRLLGTFGTVFALGAFSLNTMLLFYSSDLKQYSTDVIIALLIYLAVAFYLSVGTLSSAVVLASVGLVAVTCSHPAVFLLASSVPVLLYRHRRGGREIGTALLIVFIWAAAFLALYLFYYRVVGQDKGVVDYWNNLDGLMPIPPWKQPDWFTIRGASYIALVVGLSAPTLLCAALYVIGIVSFCLRHKGEWSVVLLASTAATLAASALVNYPFKGRLILFLVPSTLLAIGEGLEASLRLFGSRRWIAQVLGWPLIVLLLWGPALNTYGVLSQPRYAPYKEDIKPVLGFVQAHWRPGDLVVVDDQASPTYAYYAALYGLKADAPVLANVRNHPRRYKIAIDALPRQQRIWFIFSNILDTKSGPDVREYILDYVDKTGGQRLESYAYDNVSLADLVILK
jgi:hypothetical protein